SRARARRTHQLRRHAVPQCVLVGQPSRHAVPSREEPSGRSQNPREPAQGSDREGDRMSRLRLTALVLASLLALSVANAQEQWAVQVVALRDFREAQSTAADLRLLGLDAYTEFAMLNSQQWVRVRIGCFGSREAADAMAEALRTRITADAQAVERGNATTSLHCTHETV